MAGPCGLQNTYFNKQSPLWKVFREEQSNESMVPSNLQGRFISKL